MRSTARLSIETAVWVPHPRDVRGFPTHQEDDLRPWTSHLEGAPPRADQEMSAAGYAVIVERRCCTVGLLEPNQALLTSDVCLIPTSCAESGQVVRQPNLHSTSASETIGALSARIAWPQSTALWQRSGEAQPAQENPGYVPWFWDVLPKHTNGEQVRYPYEQQPNH